MTLEWQVRRRRRSSTSTRSRRSSAARTSTACPARAMRCCKASARSRRCRRDRRGGAVLVVANETLAGDELVEAVKRRAERGADPRARDRPRQRAERRATSSTRTRAGPPPAGGSTRTLAALREAGIPAPGDVVEGEPARRREGRAGAGARRRADRLHPSGDEVRLAAPQPDRRDREVAGDRPVEHIVIDRSGKAGANVLVVANETVLGEPLLERIRGARREGPASFLIVCPQSDPTRPQHPEAERRLRTALASCGRRGSRRTGRSRTRIRTRRRCRRSHDERIDEIIVSTFPGERSRLAAARPRRAAARGRREGAGRARRRRPVADRR